MLKYSLVAIGGAIGAVLRYAVLGLAQAGNTVFPWGTFTVNTIGSFLIGFLWVFFEQGFLSPNVRIFLFIGILGGFTTFSSFSLETMNLIRDSEKGLAMLNILFTMVSPLVCAFGGLFIGKYVVSLFRA